MLIKDVQNSIMYFSATIFSLLGFTSPILTSLSVAVTNFVFTLLALLIIDRVGRRAILLRSIPVMIAGLVLCSVSVRNSSSYFIPNSFKPMVERYLQEWNAAWKDSILRRNPQ